MSVIVQAGVASKNAKSYAYDNVNYNNVDPMTFALAAAGSSAFKLTQFTQKQMRSVTIVPTTAPTVNDTISLTLVSLAAQVFGTATGLSYLPSPNGGTNTATSSNTVTIPTLVAQGTQPAFNPLYTAIDGGTYTVVVANGQGTNTQTGYVFPTGPNGGLTLNPGDVLTLTKGTDTVGAYQGEIELTFTPGTLLTI